MGNRLRLGSWLKIPRGFGSIPTSGTNHFDISHFSVLDFFEWGCSSAGRAHEWHSWGRGFDPHQLHHEKSRGCGFHSLPATSFLCTNCAVDFPLNTLSKMSTAFTLWLGARWAYRSVMLNCLCPRSSLTVIKSTPPITKWEANVCLRSWKRKSLILALLHAEWNDLLTSW